MGRQLTVDAFLRERQRRHENHQQHEEHVDERRKVHLDARPRHFRVNDSISAQVSVGV